MCRCPGQQRRTSGAQLRSPEGQDMTSLPGHFSRPRHMMFVKGFLESKFFIDMEKFKFCDNTDSLLNDN